MLKTLRTHSLVVALLTTVSGLLAAPAAAQVSLTSSGIPYTQNFDTLPASGSATWTNNATIAGWYHARTGTGTTIVANDGGSNAGNLYSYGTATTTDRALGSVGSGGAGAGNFFWGVRLLNNTGATITSLDVSYTGEQWRNGGGTGLAQTVAFSYLVGSSAVTGTLAEFQSAGVAVSNLNFTSPVFSTTAATLNGNLAANRTGIAFTITGLNIPNGTEVMLRWSDPDHPSNDHGLAIDDFSVTPHTTVTLPTLTVNDVSLNEGDAGTTSFTFTVSLSAPAGPGGVTFDIATQDNTAISAGDYTAKSLTGQTIPAGSSTYSLTVLVSGDTAPETNESFFVNVTNVANAILGDGQGLGTIVNDDPRPIHDIQGTGTISPYLSQIVMTEGIVTGVKSNGFFIQLPDAEADADLNSSEGVFVFTSSAPPAVAVVGNRLRVTGKVSEFKNTTSDPDGLSATELTSPTVDLRTTGNILPTPVTLTAAEFNPGASIFTLEKYEGMRVHVAEVVSTSPTGGIVTSVSEANASSTSNGLFFAVVPGTPRPFREPGIQTPLPIPAEAPAGATPPIWDGNPERIGVDTNAIALTAGAPVGTTLDITTGVTVDNVTGPLDYAFRSYIIDTEPWNAPVAITANAPVVPVRPRNDDEFTVATFNMERFFDTIADPTVSDVVLTPAAFERRLNKASIAIRNVLLIPDVVGVEEMENLTTLQAVATRVNNDAILAGQGDPHYVAYLAEGNDIGGIDSGLLVRSDRIDVDSVTQYGKDMTYADPGGGTPLLNDRPPLVLRGHVRNDPFDAYAVTVIVNHLRSLSGVDGPDGLRIRTKRRVQAEYLATLIQELQTVSAGHPIAERVISVGDYNAFDVNDGYVDSIGTIKGTPTPADQVTQASPDLVDPDLIDLVSLAPADQRYSFMFDGNAQELDHLLVTTGPSNALLVNGVNYARMDADFPDVLRNDASSPSRISDHDPIVGYFSLPDLDFTPPTITVPASFSLEGDVAGGAMPTYTATATDGVDGSISPVCDHPAGSLFTVGATLVTCTATDTHGNVATGTFTITVTDTTAPTLSLPSSMTVEATGPTGAAVTFSATAFDIVSGSLTPSCDAVSGATFPLGSATVTCSATDAAGNTTSGSFGVTVVDTTPPELTVPAPIVIEATSASGATVAYAASALDLVDGSVTPSCGPPSGSTFAIGSTLATCTATDAHGNVATRTFTVTVRDTTPPVIVSVTATPSVVWPPNKRMVPVSIVVNATDAVSAPVCTLTGITGDDGSTGADWQITGALAALVRADRTGGGSGRTYTLALICTDAAGNAAGFSATVVVPHDQRK